MKAKKQNIDSVSGKFHYLSSFRFFKQLEFWVVLLVPFFLKIRSPLGPLFPQNQVPFLNILGPLLDWAQCSIRIVQDI